MSKIFIIDRMTLLAEKAAALASTVELEDDVLHITEPIVKVLEPGAVQTTELLDETLNNNGVQTQRIMTKTVRVTTPKPGAVTVQKDTADTVVDNVKVQTSFATVTMDAALETAFPLESLGTNKVAVTFDTGKTTTMKISFPGRPIWWLWMKTAML